MLRDIEKLRDRFNDAAIEQSIVWINRIDKKQWVEAPAHWGEAGRLERPAAGALDARRAGGEGKGESKDTEAPAPGVAQRSQVSVAGRIHYKCLDSKLEFALGDMCIIKPEMGSRMVSDEGNLLRFFVGKIIRKHSTGSLLIHWSLLRSFSPRSATHFHHSHFPALHGVWEWDRYGSPDEYDTGYTPLSLKSGAPFTQQFDPAEVMFFFHSLHAPSSPGGPRKLPPVVLSALIGDEFPRLPRHEENEIVATIRRDFSDD